MQKVAGPECRHMVRGLPFMKMRVWETRLSTMSWSRGTRRLLVL